MLQKSVKQSRIICKTIFSTPTPTANHTKTKNYYSILDNDNELNRQRENYGLLNSGTTDHFVAPNAEVQNIRPTDNVFKLKFPNVDHIRSTHQCNIDWPDLPENAKKAHIIPQLQQQSLLSVLKLCDAGCKVTF